MSLAPVLRARILGCGSSGGVPRVDGDWGVCDPKEVKNRRSRCSLLVERAISRAALKAGEVTRVLIDTSPDLRSQLLSAGVTRLDAVVYTHAHADQAHGIDDVRALVYRRGSRLPAYMDAETHADLEGRFGYIFKTPPQSSYPALMDAHVIDAAGKAVIYGEGGPIPLQTFPVRHGSIGCAGLRFGPIAYTPDVSHIDDAGFAALEGLGLWIVDSLRERPHPSHSHLGQTLEWITRVTPGMSVLTNLHIDLDYRSLLKRSPAGVRPAYDGLSITVEEESGRIVHSDPS